MTTPSRLATIVLAGAAFLLTLVAALLDPVQATVVAGLTRSAQWRRHR